MRKVASDEEKFEVWDGGHCFIRAKLTPQRDLGGKGFIEISRWPERASLEDVIAFGEWAKERNAQPKS